VVTWFGGLELPTPIPVGKKSNWFRVSFLELVPNLKMELIFLSKPDLDSQFQVCVWNWNQNWNWYFLRKKKTEKED
jgi:hypothetical protein